MNKFYAYNPTKILFGQDMCARIGPELAGVKKILLLSGRGSIHRNGAFDQIAAALHAAHIPFVHVPGIEPNPEYDTCMAALDIARREGIDFILAAGGGSVIDAAKFLALAYHAKADPWEIIRRKAPMPDQVLPIGCVLTLPASGSEMNNALVLSRRVQARKIAFNAHNLYPRFSVLDPAFTLFLSAEQTALGIVDMFVHTLEQYITYPASAALQDRQAEAILLTLRDAAPQLMADPSNIRHRETIMWCGTQAINGTISRGVPVDWSTHVIGHELTALYDLPHAKTLTLTLGGVYRHRFQDKKEKLAQYGRRVWALSGDDDPVARAAIDRTEAFFQSLSMPVRLSEAGLYADQVAASVRAQLDGPDFAPLGERQNITLDDIESILRLQA